MTTNSLPSLLNTEQVAEYLDLPKRTLEQWRAKKSGPPFIRLGKHARYPEDGLLRWINEMMATQHD